MDGNWVRLTHAIVRATLERGGVGDELNLSAYTHIDDDAAAALALFEDRLILDGLVEISDATAVHLGHHEGYLLALGGLRELPVALAEALASHDGCLALNGVSALSVPSALAIATQRGELELNGLTQLSPAVAAALARHQSSPNFNSHHLFLNGLTTVSDEAVSTLAHYAGSLSLDGLTTLSHAAAAGLAQHQGNLSLSGLATVSDAAAEALAQHRGSLFLDGLTTVSDVTARALAQRQGDLSLNGLTEVTDSTAAALATHQGSLSLSGLTQLSVRSMLFLAMHRGTLRGSDRTYELSTIHPSEEQMAQPLGDSWFMSPEGRCSATDCSDRNAKVLETYIQELTRSPRPDQLTVAHRLADRLSESSGFTGMTYAMHPWAPAYRCRMLAAVVRWLVDLGDKARAEQVLRDRSAWGFGAPAWQDVDWVMMAIRHWLGVYWRLFGMNAHSPVDFARQQGWWSRNLALLEKEQGIPKPPET